ncbi:hypothetical protein SESBI_01771 [Sesbania bispinosa]|nr:hypothetical protein SESBI_01771 [Sesbania bispinosa]
MSDPTVNIVLLPAGAANPSSTTRNHHQLPVLSSTSSISCSSDMTCEFSSAFKGKAEEDTPVIMKSMLLVRCPRCFVYVMSSEEDPKCPQCKSTSFYDILSRMKEYSNNN